MTIAQPHPNTVKPLPSTENESHSLTIVGYLLQVENNIDCLDGRVEGQCPDAPVGEVGHEVQLEGRGRVVAHGANPRPHRPHGEVQCPKQSIPEIQAGHAVVLLPLWKKDDCDGKGRGFGGDVVRNQSFSH